MTSHKLFIQHRLDPALSPTSVPTLYGSGSQRMPVQPAVFAPSQNLIEMPTVFTSELLNQKYGFDNQQSVFTIPRDDSDTLLKFKSLGQ